MRLTPPRLGTDLSSLITSLYDVLGRMVVSVNTLEDSRVLRGSGSPEGVIVANIGALYVRSDGSTSTTLYVKTAGDGLSTGWTAK